MKVDEIHWLIEAFRSTEGDDKTNIFLDISTDTFTYEESKLIGTVTLHVKTIEKRIDELLVKTVSKIEGIYNFFKPYNPISAYAETPVFLINDEEDVNVKMGISDFDNDGSINIGFKEGLNFNDHFRHIYNNIGINTDVVLKFELKKEKE